MSDPRFAEYLAALSQKLDGTPRANARALAEIASHLADVAGAEAAAGKPAAEAAAAAIARVGSVDVVAARFAAEVDDALGLRVAMRLARLAMSWLFVAGLAGFLAEPIAWLIGRDAFVGDERNAVVTPARCAQLMRLHHLSDCNAALMEDHFGELVQFGLLAAVLAALVLWALAATLRRVDPLRGRVRLDAWTARAGAAMFLAFAVSDFAHADGRGLVGGSVAALAAILFATRTARRHTT